VKLITLKLLRSCQELLSQYSSQHCGACTYILAVAEHSLSSSFSENRHRQLHPILLLFLVHNYLPLAHNLNSSERTWPTFSIKNVHPKSNVQINGNLSSKPGISISILSFVVHVVTASSLILNTFAKEKKNAYSSCRDQTLAEPNRICIDFLKPC
jgi:hypothetical protein